MEDNGMIYEDVKINVNGKEYTYFMCERIETINKKIAELGCRKIIPIDYRYNPHLSETVRQKMIELKCIFSMTLSHGVNVVNYFTGKGTPYIIFLSELKSKSDKRIDALYGALKNFQTTLNEKKLGKEPSLTPLMSATALKETELAEKILAAGSDVNEKGIRGFTAMHVAAITGNTEMVRFLLDHGANPNLTNDNGYSPIILALQMNRTEVSKMLLDAGAKIEIPLTNKVNQEKLTFNQKLNYYISEFTMHGQGKESAIYKATEYCGQPILDRKTFSKIRNNKGANYHPTKKNVFLLAIGMHLTIAQTEDLLSSAGYAFDSTSKFDSVVKRFIEERNFNMGEIEDTLCKESDDTFCKYGE